MSEDIRCNKDKLSIGAKDLTKNGRIRQKIINKDGETEKNYNQTVLRRTDRKKDRKDSKTAII